MSPSRPFIMRPVATSLLMAAIFLAGVVGFQFLPLSALPEVDYPTIQVQTFYPGASPEVMATTVTAPLERQFGEMADLNRMSSTSSGGASVITLQFNLDLSLDVAEQEVQAAMNAASNLLPADLPAPPIYAKINPADAPIMSIALSSKTLPLTQVQDLADTRMAQKISQVAGVGLVSLSGGQRPAVRIQANPRALAAYGMSMEGLRTAIGNSNANGAKGSFDGPTRAYTINANDQLSTQQDYADLIVAYKNGAPVRLSDVANVVQGAENTQLGAWKNTTPAVILTVQRQPGANVITTVDQIKAGLPALEASLPAGVQASVLTDRTTGIRASVHDVEFELLLSVALVVAVIFVFLRVLAGHLHRQRGRAPVARRHLRGDVPAGLQPQQPDPDGADHRHRLRGRRRHRHDREHLPLHRGGRCADGGGAEGRGADRLHHHLADRLADRGADPAAVHGRRGGPAVPRVRHHAGHHHRDLGRRVPDPGADALGALAEAQPTRRTATADFGPRPSEKFDDVIDRYDRALTWVLDRQAATLIVAVGHAAR